jgi:Isochorismatase family
MAPLLQPADCSILFIDPRKRHIEHFNGVEQQRIAQRFTLVAQALQAGAVPCHLAFVGSRPGPEEWLAGTSQIAPAEVHVLGSAGPSWSSSGLASALAMQNRASLILCGFWLETNVTFIALPALASGFDVFVLLDAAPARAEEARRPATDRLLHAGAVPLTTLQLVAEWMEASAGPEQRSALSLLVPTD